MIKTITLKWLQSKREDMNTQNFARLEACKRLVEAGIVLETDFYWVKLITRDEWVLSTLDNVVLKFYESIPAPLNGRSVERVAGAYYKRWNNPIFRNGKNWQQDLCSV